MTDPRLIAYLEIMRERPDCPFYAYGAWVLASQLGDLDAAYAAVRLGAADWQPEPVVRMRTEEEPEGKIIQLRLFEEAA